MKRGLKGLSPRLASLLESASQPRRLKRGDELYHAGEAPHGLFFVESGLVGLVVSSHKGGEHLLRLFGPGSMFGHRSLLAQEPYHGSARALENSDILFVSASTVQAMLSQESEFTLWIARILARELGQAESRRVQLTEEGVLSRTAAAVVYLKETAPDHTWTRQEIAHFCASTTPSVIRALAELETRGWIEQDGRQIRILDRESLLQASQDDSI